ncbi:hypothetical protein CWE05_05160 [Bifidobacterium longum]|uniref:Uncharacterized protein n=1 Tax=Bifidobacterium longum TaxID=216816 RepID=A0A2U2RSP8_BIFLN|nr:hypothetical protein CWE05_05160 [Bifidobacterium longum]
MRQGTGHGWFLPDDDVVRGDDENDRPLKAMKQFSGVADNAVFLARVARWAPKLAAGPPLRMGGTKTGARALEATSGGMALMTVPSSQRRTPVGGGSSSRGTKAIKLIGAPMYIGRR